MRTKFGSLVLRSLNNGTELIILYNSAKRRLISRKVIIYQHCVSASGASTSLFTAILVYYRKINLVFEMFY